MGREETSQHLMTPPETPQMPISAGYYDDADVKKPRLAGLVFTTTGGDRWT